MANEKKCRKNEKKVEDALCLRRVLCSPRKKKKEKKKIRRRNGKMAKTNEQKRASCVLHLYSKFFLSLSLAHINHTLGTFSSSHLLNGLKKFFSVLFPVLLEKFKPCRKHQNFGVSFVQWMPKRNY